MAQKTTTVLVDDLTGVSAEEQPVEQVDFGLDGATYEIDLTDTNAKELRQSVAEYVAAARRRPGSPRRRSRGPAAARPAPTGAATARVEPRRGRSPQENEAIRNWAKRHGFSIGARGRIPAAVLERYDAHTASL